MKIDKASTLGDLIAAVHDEADLSTHRTRDRRRLTALWTTVLLLGSGNDIALRRLVKAR